MVDPLALTLPQYRLQDYKSCNAEKRDSYCLEVEVNMESSLTFAESKESLQMVNRSGSTKRRLNET